MPRDGSKTRDRILETTTHLVLENGFAGTTIDHILEETQLTKGAFFYHFKSKSDLALELMRYFAKKDFGELQSVLSDTEPYASDPRERLLQFVQWFIDVFQGLDTPFAGCLYASYIYEPEQFNQEIKDIVADGILLWRDAITRLINEAEEEGHAQIAYDAESLADMFTVILEGAFIVSKALNDAAVTANQLIHYRNYLALIFSEAK